VLPTATSASLSLWLKVTSAETTTTTAYDTLKVQVVSGTTTTTLATYSNLNKGSTYVQKTLNMTPYVGKTVTLKVVGAEDSSLATSFFVDDFSVTTS
jgi:aminopeptidase S